MVSMFSPLLIFIAVIFFTSKMAARTEIVAILSSGVSFNRYLLPYFVSALMLSILSLGLNHFGVPYANKKRIAFEEAYFKSTFRNHDKDIHKRITANDIAYFEKYNAQSNIGYKFALEHWEREELTFKLMAF